MGRKGRNLDARFYLIFAFIISTIR